MSKDDHPPNICNSVRMFHFEHAKMPMYDVSHASIFARFNALRHADVLHCLTGFPS